MKTQFTNNRIVGLDLFRSLSVLYIIGYWHLFSYTTAFPLYNNIFTYKLTLIILGSFTLISGYFLGKKELKFTPKDIVAFYQKRLLRIYPLYLIALFLFTVLGLSNHAKSLKAAILISMLVKPPPMTLWFITMLLLFYLISPLLIYVVQSSKIKLYIFYHIIIFALVTIYSHFTQMLDTRLIMYLPSFFLGIYLAKKELKITTKSEKLFFILLAVISMAVSFIKSPYEEIKAALDASMILTFSYLFFQVSKNLKISSKQIIATISYISYASYAMYLFHRSIYEVLTRIFSPKSQLVQALYLFAFCLPIIIFASFIIQKAYDTLIEKLNNTRNKKISQPS